MSGSASEISESVNDSGAINGGRHLAYIFGLSSEKQSTLFQLCERTVASTENYLLYLSGKQGVKGIRLSLKDVGFDVAQYERAHQFRIVDSEDWFLTASKQRTFKSNEELREQIALVVTEALSTGHSNTTIISETDSLVRKGFYSRYIEFDQYLSRTIPTMRATFVCAFDFREIDALRIPNSRNEIARVHSGLL